MKPTILRENKFYFEEDLDGFHSFDLNKGVVLIYTHRNPLAERHNQDSAAIFPVGKNSAVIALADGVGGAPNGAQASRTVMEVLADSIENAKLGRVKLREAILDGLEKANALVINNGKGSATTLALIEVFGNQVRPYHVGDSAIFVVGQKGKIKCETIDHSPVGYAYEAGYLTEREALAHEERNVVSNVIGSESMHIQIGVSIKMSLRDTALLASDGLFDNFKKEELSEMIRKGGLSEAMNNLIDACGKRMLDSNEDVPSKPDDLTSMLFRRK